jgi:hypothetical protein
VDDGHRITSGWSLYLEASSGNASFWGSPARQRAGAGQRNRAGGLVVKANKPLQRKRFVGLIEAVREPTISSFAKP